MTPLLGEGCPWLCGRSRTVLSGKDQWQDKPQDSEWPQCPPHDRFKSHYCSDVDPEESQWLAHFRGGRSSSAYLSASRPALVEACNVNGHHRHPDLARLLTRSYEIFTVDGYKLETPSSTAAGVVQLVPWGRYRTGAWNLEVRQQLGPSNYLRFLSREAS